MLFRSTDSPMKILLGGICFIGLAILAVVAILASGFVLRENYQHKAFYSVPAIQLKKYSAINEWIDECKTIGPDIYGQCIELPSDKTICLYIVYRHQVTDASGCLFRKCRLFKCGAAECYLFRSIYFHVAKVVLKSF